MSKEEINFKAAIVIVIVAFIYVEIILLSLYLPFKSKINSAISLINMISINTTKKIQSKVTLNLESNRLDNYPEYGTRYATIKIEDLGIDLPLYYGDKLSVLRSAVGQSSGGYFPGEGGSIVCMAHNVKGLFKELPNIQMGTKIEVETVYGTYIYTAYDTKVITKYDVGEIPIQHDEEILILYTCYPPNIIGHAPERFVVFAKPEL